MILRDLLKHFNIGESFPEYLLAHPFNRVFLEGELSESENTYKIAVTTRQDVTHQMFLRPGDDYPLIILSELPSGKSNGMKFGLTEDDVTYISRL